MQMGAIETGFIHDIGRTSSSLWIRLAGGYGPEKFREVVFRILLRAPDISFTRSPE
jgi:hypothetical protein